MLFNLKFALEVWHAGVLIRAANRAIHQVADVFAARRIRQSDSLANLAFNALFRAALNGIYTINSI